MALYDKIAEQYEVFVRQNLADETSVYAVATQSLLDVLGECSTLDICDLGCGEGYLSVYVAQQAQSVVGIDLSQELVKLAKAKIETSNLSFWVDDAQSLASQVDQSFDRIISNMAIMDISDLEKVYQAVFRVLRPSGRFIFSLTHPCFQAPHTSIHVDENDKSVAQCVRIYATESFWRSDNPNGIRGQVGAYHRTLSTYLNLAMKTGFTLIEVNEPTLPPKDYNKSHIAAQIEIPSIMVIVLQK